MTAEEAFHQAMLDNYSRAGQETGYWGNYFLREVRRKGGLATAKRMLRPSQPGHVAKGMQALIDAGRTDLSVEATVLQTRFLALFTDQEIAEAERRLKGLPSYVRRRPIPPESNFPNELDAATEFSEGATRRVVVNAFERSQKARDACVAKFGFRCAVCGMSFEERYGEIGRRFIHVHHKKPLAARRKAYELRPTTDLIPVCPNCHAMLHVQDPPLGVDQLRDVLKKRAST